MAAGLVRLAEGPMELVRAPPIRYSSGSMLPQKLPLVPAGLLCLLLLAPPLEAEASSGPAGPAAANASAAPAATGLSSPGPSAAAQSGGAAPGASASLPSCPILPDDPAPLLGLGLAESYLRLGAPASVAAFRGVEAWQDDVVFSFGSGYSLFWFGDRLWQIRFTPGYGGSVYGLFLGDGKDKVYSLLGAPFYEAEGSLVYRLPYRGYPVRLRVVVAEGRVADLYLYRADF